MIYDLARGVDTIMQARSYPVRVVYGPERLKRGTPTDSVIVVERDRDAGDQFQPTQGVRVNTRRVATRMLGARATIWAKTNLAGARVNEHEAYCEQLVDAFYVAVHEWMQAATGVATFGVSEAKYLAAHELADVEAWTGVVYSLRWRVPRGVYSTDYHGLGLPTGEATATTGEVLVRRNADDPPEIVELP